MTFNDLNILSLVVKNASFNKTAQQLGVSPQYINKKISKIEREFDTIIFNRTSNGLILTPKGILISNFAQKVIEQKRILDTHSLTNASYSLVGKIKIITTPIIISDFYNSYIPNFLNTYPGINIEFYETDGANVFKQLQKDTNSLGISTIITNPEYHLLDAYEDSLNFHPLIRDWYIILAHPNFFPISKQSFSLRELVDYPAALTVIDSQEEMQIIKILKSYGEPNILITANNYLAYMSMIISKKAYGIFPRSLFKSMPHYLTQSLSCYDIEEDIFMYTALISNKNISFQPTKTLLEYLKNVATNI